MHILRPGIWKKTKTKTKKKTKQKLKTVENEKCTLQNLEYGKKNKQSEK